MAHDRAWHGHRHRRRRRRRSSQRPRCRRSTSSARCRLAASVGEILQTPPAYSALKVDGQRAYALARARRGRSRSRLGRSPSTTCACSTGADRADARGHVLARAPTSASLARDIALALGTVGHLSRPGPHPRRPLLRSTDALTAGRARRRRRRAACCRRAAPCPTRPRRLGRDRRWRALANGQPAARPDGLRAEVVWVYDPDGSAGRAWRAADGTLLRPRLPYEAKPAIVTIGNFDGVHLGHQKLIQPGRRPRPRARAVQPGHHLRAAPRAGALPRAQADATCRRPRSASELLHAMRHRRRLDLPVHAPSWRGSSRRLHAHGHRAPADRRVVGRRRLRAGPRSAGHDLRAGRDWQRHRLGPAHGPAATCSKARS